MTPSTVEVDSALQRDNGASQTTLPSPIHPSFLERLDQDFIDYYNAHFAIKPVTHTVDISEIRKYPKKFTSPWAKDFTYEPFVNDIEILGEDENIIRLRCYKPDARTSPYGTGPYPVHVNFHGGGFAHGDLTGDAELCMLVRDRVGILVVDVEYRLSPEHIYFKGHEDAWSAIRWVHESGDSINAKTDSISIGGISAGAHISAVCQQIARDAGFPLKLAILAVPATLDFCPYNAPEDSPYPSYKINALSPCLNWKRIRYFADLIQVALDRAGDAGKRPNFWSNPIEGSLISVCKTFIATADCDPLRDEGEDYGRKLIEAGVTVTTHRYMGVPHPFMHMLTIKKAQEYVKDICSELKSAHSE